MIGIDWGTSSLRAYRMAGDGAILERTEAARGLMTIPPGGYPAVLSETIGGWLGAERHVLICGMAGSRQGWAEAPYLPCPARPADLALATIAVAFEGAEVRIVPGLSDRDPDGVPEVMRGEETQLAGVLGEDGLVCLPGSHSKWARSGDGRVEGFTTFLSGEAFAAIRHGTILGRMMPDAPPHAPSDAASFARGVERSGGHGHLLHQLFGVRTLGLFGELADTASASYLSGLLIGHEIRAAMPPGSRVLLVGAPALCDLYADAITRCGGVATIAAPDAAATGLFRIARDVPWN